jgi:hypothetical protein
MGEKMKLYYPSATKKDGNRLIKMTGHRGFASKTTAMRLALRDARELKTYGMNIVWAGVRVTPVRRIVKSGG